MEPTEGRNLVNQTLSANSAGVTVIWASPDFGHPHSQNPSDVNASPLIITLAIWVKVRARVTGNAHITRGLRMGMPKTCDTGTMLHVCERLVSP